MKVLLIRPPVPAYTIGLKHVMICEPLELEYLAGALTDHEVEIFDMILEKNVVKKLKSFKPDVVGMSCYITGVNEVIKLSRIVKQHNSLCKVIVGGVHASVAPEDFAVAEIDCIAMADGCETAPLIVEAFEHNGNLLDIPNIAIPIAEREVVKSNKESYMKSPDDLPLPRRDLTDHLRHKYYYLFHQPVALMKTTWGCQFDCSFCMTWKVTDGKPFSMSPESIVDELETIKEEEVYIVDDIFLINPTRLRKTADLIRQRNIKKKFLVYGRADFIAHNKEIIEEWSDLGLSAVIVGLEANTSEELVSLSKRTTLEENKKAIEILREAKVDIYASLIPQPWYTKKDWDQLFSFIEESGLYYVNVSPLSPLPGSPIFKQYEEQITLPRQAHALWDLSHCLLPTTMSLKKYYRQLLKLYAKSALSIRRANRLTLRTRPPIWSFKYLRLWLGAIRIFFQFINAHRHHNDHNLKKAMDRRTPVKTIYFKPLHDSLKKAEPFPNKYIDERRPQDPYYGYLQSHPEFDDGNKLLNLPSVKRWRNIVSWGMQNDLYTYQQPIETKSGPICTIDNKKYKMISSYDYLGLLGHPRIETAAVEAVLKYGTGAGGVRLLTGTTDLHHALDEQIAYFKRTEAALSFSSGYITNLAVITSLFRNKDRVILDSRAHRSIYDACKMAQIKPELFVHNDVNSLEDLLKNSSSKSRTIVIIEGVYSMDGDICPLPDIVNLKYKYGFYLMVDEAHSFGALGATGRGVNEHFGLSSDCVDIWMGTLSKAIPSCGGYIAGSQEMIIYLQHGSAPYMFSSAATPSSVAASLEAIKVIEDEPFRINKLKENTVFLRDNLISLGFNLGDSRSHVIPVIIGSDLETYRYSGELFKRGTVALGIASPAVSNGTCRLRLCATAAQDKEFLQKVIDDFAYCVNNRKKSKYNIVSGK